MAVNKFILIAILLGFVVSWVPRILPFVLVKYKGLPDIVVRFLHYLPVSILFALILSSLTTEKIGHLPQFKWMEILATVPTVIVAFLYNFNSTQSKYKGKSASEEQKSRF